MIQVVSSVVPFPNIWWWWQAMQAGEVIFDREEGFVKMSYRNRYYITGANGLVQLTVPVSGGRNQRTAMKDVLIDNKERWQVQHWRTIFSVYGRAPFFEHYAATLEPLFHQNFDKLVEFNEASIRWATKQTGIVLNTVATSAESDAIDTRKIFKPGIERNALPPAEALYYQLFAERNGFYPNLSILDLLFSEGPSAKAVLAGHAATIQKWTPEY